LPIVVLIIVASLAPILIEFFKGRRNHT